MYLFKNMFENKWHSKKQKKIMNSTLWFLKIIQNLSYFDKLFLVIMEYNLKLKLN